MVQAANAGITGITALIQSAQGVAQAALATTSTTDRTAFATTFDTLMTQVTQLSSDSGYRGTNLLTGASQTVEFAPTTNAATLQIKGFDATSSGLGISTTMSAGSTSSSPSTFSTVLATTVVPAYTGFNIIMSGTFTDLQANDINANPQNYRVVDSATGGTGGIARALGSLFRNLSASTLSGNFTSDEPITLQYDANGFNQTTGAPNPVTTTTPGGNSWATTAGVQSSATQLEGALTTLRTQSSSLSANLSVVTTRQDFTDSMINTLQTGADNLTLADMNKEGANMLMLQTRQQLGTTSLSMASQAAQSVLKLF